MQSLGYRELPYLFVNPLKELQLHFQVLQLLLQSNPASSGCINILSGNEAILFNR